MKPLSILIVEDDLDFQYLIRQDLARHPDLCVVGCCQDTETACAAAAAHQPDIVLMDLALGTDMHAGITAARRIRLETRSKVVILTVYDDPDTVLRASIESFASAYVAKNQVSMLLPTIRSTAAGPTPQSHLIYAALLSRLTAAERVVFQYLLGAPVSLHSSGKTIANQQTNLLRKLGLASKQQLRHVFSAYLSQTAT